ncbi:MAG: ABC transporter ATP-binding protein [Candidatus Woesearchaeota archaeon]|jgi:ABC-type branched-subunit amino acid transport system ATPase component|nr:ABC transporter ATP-binding protein [Candidatus Woesearchaeota archaeon]MDP7323562.1 ABC transporter ATP-binding protein [Candidatus Woesearchaeota archaeon]MDP7457680.1 ABC transporter ATP-binding protein [Candidatus Woesearchaeota archaeon]
MTLGIKAVSKNFGGIHALQKASLDIKKGSITAIIGPNGSGKSTLFHVISNIIKKDGGKIEFEGKDISELADFSIARTGVARTFQEVRLFKNLTIKDHLAIAISVDDECLLKNAISKPDIDEAKIKEALRLVNLDKPLNTYATDLSYGQRKLLDLAVALAKPHSLLMLDEPVAGVNPRLRKEIKAILRTLKKKGETILLIEHDMNFVMDLADDVYVLDEGRVIAQGKPKVIQKNKKVLDAYLGE